MALALGTNSGFVETAPVVDPNGSSAQFSGNAAVTRDTSPATAVKITEIGWWIENASEEANFEIGLYAADGVVVPGEAGTLLYVSATNAKGTGTGWKTVAVDWAISSSTSYWIAVQLDTTATATNSNVATSGGLGRDLISASTLSNPFGGGSIADADAMYAIYAVWAVASGPANLKTYNTNVKANIKTINTNPIANVKTLDTNA